jgi:alpha-tubulin suppressor-like RCC1 family protein
MTLMLVFLLAFPVRVFAQDEVPTAIPDPAITVPADAPVEPTAVVTEVPAEPTPVVTEVPAGPLAEATQEPAEPTAVITEVPVELLTVMEVPIETQVTAPASTETSLVAENPTLIADSVTALQEAGAVLLDAAGNPIPLASQAAAEILTAPDPIGCPLGVTPSWNSVTDMAAGCTAAYSSIQAALNDSLVGDGTGWTIFIQQGTYNENVIVDKSVKFTGQGAGATATSITLNKDIDNASSWFSSMLVIVNSGPTSTASLADGLNLVAPGGVVKTSEYIYSGVTDSHGNLNAMVRDNSNNASPTYQLECGEPDVYIYLGSTYNMIVMDPSNPLIVNYYSSDSTPDGAKELHDLCIAVNVAAAQGWASETLDNQYKQRQVYWAVLNKNDAGHPFDPAFSTLVTDIKDGDYNNVPKTTGVFFMVPTENNGGTTPAPRYAQLTFITTCDDGNPTTIDIRNEDGSCTNQTKICNDGNAQTNDFLNANGTCSFITPPPTPPTTPPLVIVPLLIPVTGNTCVPDVITAGIGHTCAITPETGLRCWGQNDTGQLGDGSKKANSTLPVKVKVLDGGEVVQLVSGTKHTCALTAGNEVFCWGLNYSGQLGDGTTTNSNIPVKVKGLEGTIVSISAGENFTCAVNIANKTMCWGNNSGGQFKNGNTFSTSTPVVANLGSDIKLVSGGQGELQGVTNAGAVQFWSNQPTIPVTGLSSDVALVSADRFSEGGCAMTTTGKVECWGAITASGITDAKVPALLETGKKTCKVDPLITGEGHGCTITKENGLVCWGKNVYGQLGNGTQTDSEIPVEVTGIRNVLHLAAGFDHTCAIVDQETIKCWGQNTYGNGTTKESSLPVLVK